MNEQHLLNNTEVNLSAIKVLENSTVDAERRHSVARSALNATYFPELPITEAALCDWIASAMVGQAIVYHEGMLLRDRASDVSTLGSKDRNRLHAVARRAWIACELGLVHLFSQKISEGRYLYLAMRSRASLTPPEIRSRLKTATPTNHAN
jgi:hypothetical protein